MCLLFWKHFLIMTILRTGHCLSCVTSISNLLLYHRSYYISPFLIYMFVSFSWLCDRSPEQGLSQMLASQQAPSLPGTQVLQRVCAPRAGLAHGASTACLGDREDTGLGSPSHSALTSYLDLHISSPLWVQTSTSLKQGWVPMSGLLWEWNSIRKEKAPVSSTQ